MRANKPNTYNSDIIEELYSLAELAGTSSHKHIAYSAAARAIWDLDYELRDRVEHQQTSGIPYVGPKIWAIIKEYYNQKKHGVKRPILTIRKELEEINAAREVFTGIMGVGDKTADEWIEAGIRSIDQLRRSSIQLTHAQSIGLQYYDDLHIRIPRAEVSDLAEQLRTKFGISFEIVGSWRRGSRTSGDVDLLASSDDEKTAAAAIHAITEQIDPKLLIGSGKTKVSFLMRGWVYMRQIDILIVPKIEYGAALLYFTGSWEFNESMRRFAKNHGYRLNQRGLYKVESPDTKSRKKLTLVASATEQDIFDALGMTFVNPANRR